MLHVENCERRGISLTPCVFEAAQRYLIVDVFLLGPEQFAGKTVLPGHAQPRFAIRGVSQLEHARNENRKRASTERQVCPLPAGQLERPW